MTHRFDFSASEYHAVLHGEQQKRPTVLTANAKIAEEGTAMLKATPKHVNKMSENQNYIVTSFIYFGGHARQSLDLV